MKKLFLMPLVICMLSTYGCRTAKNSEKEKDAMNITVNEVSEAAVVTSELIMPSPEITPELTPTPKPEKYKHTKLKPGEEKTFSGYTVKITFDESKYCAIEEGEYSVVAEINGKELPLSIWRFSDAYLYDNGTNVGLIYVDMDCDGFCSLCVYRFNRTGSKIAEGVSGCWIESIEEFTGNKLKVSQSVPIKYGTMLTKTLEISDDFLLIDEMPRIWEVEKNQDSHTKYKVLRNIVAECETGSNIIKAGTIIELKYYNYNDSRVLVEDVKSGVRYWVDTYDAGAEYLTYIGCDEDEEPPCVEQYED